MASSLNRSQNALLGIGALSLALWALPGFGIVTMPLIYLNTHVHELCHALAAIATGGSVDHISVEAGGNGLTLCRGGWNLAIDSAGYVGASLIGALMIALGGSAKGAKAVLTGLAALLAIGLVLWTRDNPVGIVTEAVWIVALIVGARRLPERALPFVTQFLGMQQALTSVLALYILLKINVQPGIQNDALIAQEGSGIPAILWALAWVAISAAGLWLGLKAAWRPSRQAE